MDDLISRKKVMDVLNELDLPDVHAALPVSLMLGIVKWALEPVPSVPAVPLEPLCRYLEVYARTPIYNMRHTAEWWKEELNRQKWNEWMEEQNA
jgi:hypothetical protein